MEFDLQQFEKDRNDAENSQSVYLRMMGIQDDQSESDSESESALEAQIEHNLDQVYQCNVCKWACCNDRNRGQRFRPRFLHWVGKILRWKPFIDTEDPALMEKLAQDVDERPGHNRNDPQRLGKVSRKWLLSEEVPNKIGQCPSNYWGRILSDDQLWTNPRFIGFDETGVPISKMRNREEGNTLAWLQRY
jgi:hypothetical protein